VLMNAATVAPGTAIHAQLARGGVHATVTRSEGEPDGDV
jgi:hypothetical protein